MSATNRSDVRQKDDFYATPEWAVHAILPYLPKGGSVLEPGCGEGAILKALLSGGFDSEQLYGVEIDETRAKKASETEVTIDSFDFISTVVESRGYIDPVDLVCMNPPFSLAMEFVQRSIALTRPRGGTVAALLRLSWLASGARHAFHREFPADVYVLPKRPEFCASLKCKKKKSGACTYEEILPIAAPRPSKCPVCGGSVTCSTTDAAEYAWFVFGPQRGGRWFLLDLPEREAKAEKPAAEICAMCGADKKKCKTLALPGCGQINAKILEAPVSVLEPVGALLKGVETLAEALTQPGSAMNPFADLALDASDVATALEKDEAELGDNTAAGFSANVKKVAETAANVRAFAEEQERKRREGFETAKKLNEAFLENVKNDAGHCCAGTTRQPCTGPLTCSCTCSACAPCELCQGHGAMPNGDSCTECDGTGQRQPTRVDPTPGEGFYNPTTGEVFKTQVAGTIPIQVQPGSCLHCGSLELRKSCTMRIGQACEPALKISVSQLVTVGMIVPAAETTEDAPKRRGRPKGSKNKPKNGEDGPAASVVALAWQAAEHAMAWELARARAEEDAT